MKRKLWKRAVAATMSAIMLMGAPQTALADSSKVVTIGADLSEEQKEKMFQYFGVSKDEVLVIEVNNQQERQYLEGIATEQQIGKRTFSCAYIMPTDGDMINVKTANLNWVSTSMIANTLVTAGINSCDVIAASPIEVSGTGALTGIIIAYEQVTEETLDEEKKELAMEELLETADLADEIGKEEAAAVINEIKAQVIEKDLIKEEQINEVMQQVASHYNVEIPEQNAANVKALMAKIGEQDYDYNAIKGTMDHLQEKVLDNLEGIKESLKDSADKKSKGILAAIGAFFTAIIRAIGNFFVGIVNTITGKGGDKQKTEEDSKVSPDSILNGTDDTIFGATAAPAATQESQPTKENQENTTNTNEPTPQPEQTQEPNKILEENTQENKEQNTTIETPEAKQDNLLGAEEKEESFSAE